MLPTIEHLLQFIREEPENPFNYYALALEYAKSNERKAVQIFEKLTEDHQSYLPTYYQLARLYERLGENEKAVNTFKSGITIATVQNDHKALRELRSALNELVEDQEE